MLSNNTIAAYRKAARWFFLTGEDLRAEALVGAEPDKSDIEYTLISLDDEADWWAFNVNMRRGRKYLTERMSLGWLAEDN